MTQTAAVAISVPAEAIVREALKANDPALQAAGADVRVVRNDAVRADEIERLGPDLVVVSPGPGEPLEAGVSVEVIRRLAGVVPIFGVCLGHQAIGAAFGADIVRARQPMHGKHSSVTHDGRGVFTGIPSPLEVVRYHSLVVDPRSLPPCLEVTAVADGEIMGLRHRAVAVEGVQFHPESVFTDHGRRIVANAASQLAARPAGIGSAVEVVGR
jgi:anthranilate synthase/aminodeoxychorismate synthase-like glutamine amidotransferase